MKYFKIASICLLISACKSEKEKQLIGKWEATQLVECEDIIPVQTDIVNIEFQSNGTYIFNSTLNVHEQGDFHLEGNYLLMQDKIKSNTPEKVVLITNLTNDSLVLEMNYKGKEQFLTLNRVFKEPVLVQEKNQIKDTIATKPIASSASNTEGVIASAVPNASLLKVEEAKPQQPKVVELKSETVSADEAYRRREAKRREEEADRLRDEKDKREAYLKREAARQKEEIEKKRKTLEREKENDRNQREAYLKREAQRKKEETNRKKNR